MTRVENILAKNKPGAFSVAKIAAINDNRYIDRIKIIPMIADIRLTFFIIRVLSVGLCVNYIYYYIKMQLKSESDSHRTEEI